MYSVQPWLLIFIDFFGIFHLPVSISFSFVFEIFHLAAVIFEWLCSQYFLLMVDLFLNILLFKSIIRVSHELIITEQSIFIGSSIKFSRFDFDFSIFISSIVFLGELSSSVFIRCFDSRLLDMNYLVLLVSVSLNGFECGILSTFYFSWTYLGRYEST